MSVIDVQSEVLLAVRNRLIKKIDRCHENNCWLDDAPIPFGKDPPPTEQCFSIVCDDGNYAQDWGGGHCALKETTSLTITHMQKLQLDDTKKLTQIIAGNKKAMLRTKRDLLTTILIERDEVDVGGDPVIRATPWRPVNDQGKYLWDQILPIGYVSPKRHRDWPLLYQYIEFRFSFFWEL